jgi:non-ribosomal peptide synthetase component E (peptide arylation enzyme)
VVAFADQAGLARQKIPQHIELVADLPRTASGKVRKDVLRQRIREQLAQSGTE